MKTVRCDFPPNGRRISHMGNKHLFACDRVVPMGEGIQRNLHKELNMRHLPCEVFRLTWDRIFPRDVTQVNPWDPGNVLIGDSLFARFRPRKICYSHSACST